MQLLQHQHLDFLQLFLSPHLDKVLYLTVLSLAVINDYNASHIENIVLWGQKVLMVEQTTDPKKFIKPTKTRKRNYHIN